MSTRPNVTKDNYPATLPQLWTLAELVREALLSEMLAAAERATVVGPILESIRRPRAGGIVTLNAARRPDAPIRDE